MALFFFNNKNKENMNLDYMTVSQFIDERSKAIGKIAVYDLLITKMEQRLDTAIDSADLIQYELDDGQMKCRAQYRSVDSMLEALERFRKARQYYKNQANGSLTVLRSGNL